MPAQNLSQDQVGAILTYLEGDTGDTSSQQPAAAQDLPSGEVKRGEALFMGDSHLQNDGPPCMGCHNVDSKGLLGGSALGPDLTNVSSRYSEAGLIAAMAGIPWPTMQPIYSEHLLTIEEQADLIAFLQSTAGQPETNRELVILGISLTGFLLAVAFIGFIYRRRLRGVRKPLVERITTGGKYKERLP